MRADLRVRRPVDGVRLSLWRAVTIFRVAALLGCLVLIVKWHSLYARPSVAFAVGAAMIVVTVAISALAVRGQAHRLTVVGPDLVITAGLTLLTIPAQTHAQSHGGMVTLTTVWAAGPAIEAAYLTGALGGFVAAAVQFGAAAAVREGYTGDTLYSGVLLLVTGTVAGFVATLTVRAEDELRVAAAAQAALAERERLARSIHDGVLQVLGLVHRAGRDAGGTWQTLAAAAAEQEVALRGLITSAPATVPAGQRDLSEDLRTLRSQQVTVSTPAEPVTVPAGMATELQAAVRAALHNVEAHAGPAARAWVLLEAFDDELRITVRDDGAGMAPSRLDDAAHEGRIGVARSVRGRIVELGGTCTYTSADGAGTEIEMAVPR